MPPGGINKHRQQQSKACDRDYGFQGKQKRMDERILEGFVLKQRAVIAKSCHVEVRSHVIPVSEADSYGCNDGNHPEQNKEYEGRSRKHGKYKPWL